jgi:hypothetical protein
MDQENLPGHIPFSVSTLTWRFPKICVTRRLESPGTLYRTKPLARIEAAFDRSNGPVRRCYSGKNRLDIGTGAPVFASA